VALAAWRRVAEQRRRAVDGDLPVVGSDNDAPVVADLVGPAAIADPGPVVAAEPTRPAAPVAEPVLAAETPPPAPVAEPLPAADTTPPTPEPEPVVAAEPTRPAAGVPVVRDGAADSGGPRAGDTHAGSESHAGPEAPLPSRAGHGDGPPSGGRLHDVLLGLAGRLDDDALTSVREMVAAEDDAEAAELLGGCLLAGGVGLTPGERSVLRPWFTAARVDPDLLALLPADSGALSRSVHRFAPTAADRVPGLPLARAARRLPGVVAVRESWRVTPAGSAPGPVPHRVVLVETAGPDDCDHVVHHLAHAARSLDDTSVEVFPSGAALPAYHREALAAARPLVADGAVAGPSVTTAPAPPAERPAPPRFGAVDDDETWRTVADSDTARPATSTTMTPPTGDRPYPDEEEPDLADLDDPAGAEDPVDAGTAGLPAVAVEREERVEPAVPETPPETSIDDDLSSTARRIAALWARPAPEDFSAPLPDESLEPTRLEPDGEHVAPHGIAAEVDAESGNDDGTPSGRHGLPAAPDPGTSSSRSPSSGSRTNGHRVDPEEPVDGIADTASLDSAEPQTGAPVADDGSDPDTAQVQRARHSRARDGDAPPEADPDPARYGHDARFGAGAGPAWPGGPVTGDPGPGPDTLFASPVEIGEEPVTFGTNGHRHGPVPAVPDDEPVTLGTNGHRHEPTAGGPHEEPATGPVAWAGPAGPGGPPPYAGAAGPPPHAGPPHAGRPHAGPPAGPPPAGPPAVGHPAAGPPAGIPGGPVPGPVGNGPGPRRPGDPGDVAPPWAAADGAGWPSEAPGWSPAADGGPGRPPEAESTAAWSPDLDDSVAQLSDRERELLARLHEELAQRERAEGADPFAGPPPPSDRPAPPQPPAPGPGGSRRPRPGPPPGPPPGGRVNGHGLPGNPDDTGA
jgi:hypothetical protein